MAKTVLDVERRELGGGLLSVRVVQDEDLFRFEPVGFSDDTDANLEDLLSRAGTLLQLGSRNWLHVKTQSAPARDALMRSLRVVDGLEPMDPSAWPASDEDAAGHAARDEDEGWDDNEGVFLTRWLDIDDVTIAVWLEGDDPVFLRDGTEMCLPTLLISVYSRWGQLFLGSLPDGQMIRLETGDLGEGLERLVTAESQSDLVVDWLRGYLLGDSFALQVFLLHTDLDDEDTSRLMDASTGFEGEESADVHMFEIHMPDDQIAAVVDRICALDEYLVSLRTAVEQAESEPGRRLRAVLQRSRQAWDDDVGHDLMKWFPGTSCSGSAR